MSDSDKQNIEQLIGDLDRLELAESRWERAELCADRRNDGPRNAMRDYWTKEQREATFARLEQEREPYRLEADGHKQTVLTLRQSITGALDSAIAITALAGENSIDLRTLQNNLKYLYSDPVFVDAKLISTGCFVDDQIRKKATSFLKDLLIRLAPENGAKPAEAIPAKKRRGRLPKAESEAIAASVLAKASQTPGLARDFPALASLCGTSERNVRRIIQRTLNQSQE